MCGPQAGEARADDGDIGVEVAIKRGARRQVVINRGVPETEPAIVDARTRG
jgi:hypothetical protein